jgi:hypothetical protein
VACGSGDSSGPADAAQQSAASDADAVDVAHDASTDAAVARDAGGAMEADAGDAIAAHDAGSAIEAGADAAATLRTYTTLFPLTENPISESGNWVSGQSIGLDWHDVSTTPGLAIGHQSVTSYTDGTALLTGSWGPTQSVEAVVHTVNQKDSCYQEVELRLRSSLSAHSCTGYEVSFKASKTAGAYFGIVRWNGPVGDFTNLSAYSGAKYGVAEGDTVRATIEGNVINAYLNGVMVGTATDSTYSSGNPGMGFNLKTTDDPSCVGTNGDYGFTRLTATGQ